MIFSVQNNNLMFSVVFSADLVQIQVRETVCHITQVPIIENQLEEMQMMEEVAEHEGMNYPETLDSRYVAQPFDDFLFPWEEGSVNNTITIEEDEGFSEPRTPVSEPPVMEARPTLRSIENLQSFENSAARQLFDL